jgi:hypothetical protein
VDVINRPTLAIMVHEVAATPTSNPSSGAPGVGGHLHNHRPLNYLTRAEFLASLEPDE